jgi:hypothetical protein
VRVFLFFFLPSRSQNWLHLKKLGQKKHAKLPARTEAGIQAAKNKITESVIDGSLGSRQKRAKKRS